MIVVTGALGFIGKNLVQKLLSETDETVLSVDKYKNINKKYPYLDHLNFLKNLSNKNFANKISFIFHQGANSNTLEKNFTSIIEDNFFYTMQLIEMCEKFNIPLIYASSASVYGCNSKNFNENSKLDPSNYYSISKSLIDLFVKKKILKNNKLKIIGLRYFNVYGPGEEKKKEMASVFFHFNKQMKKKLSIKLFKGTGGYNNGEQKRDFIHVDDCVNINLFFYKKFKSGVYNVGTGVASTFNEIAKSIFNFYKKKIMIKYIDMPKDLSDSYQNFTKANINKLRNAGYVKNFINIKKGIANYFN